jgi:RNA polymerase sigma-70 factor (ECF subfamily)
VTVDRERTEGPARERLVSIAYRMVGSRTEAEDLVQETMLRVHVAAEHQQLDSVDAFATTVLTRLAIDHLRSARVRREAYVGPWLPEPIAVDPAGDAERAAETADSLSLAFMVVLESLAPAERAALLLHDVFAYDYAAIANILDRSEAACRQLVSRARQRVAERRPRFDVDPAHHAALLSRFLDAARAGDVDGLIAILAEDAVVISDGGGGVKAARFPILGRDRSSRFLAKVMRRHLAHNEVRITTVNGLPGFAVISKTGLPINVGTLDIADGRVLAVHMMLNPEKLHWIADA